MKAYRGSRGITPLILDFSTRWRWVINFMSQLLYPGKHSKADVRVPFASTITKKILPFPFEILYNTTPNTVFGTFKVQWHSCNQFLSLINNNNSPGAKSEKLEIQPVNGHKTLPETSPLHCALAYIVMVKNPVTRPRTWDFTVNCISPALNNLYSMPGSQFRLSNTNYEPTIPCKSEVSETNQYKLTFDCNMQAFSSWGISAREAYRKSSHVVRNTEEE